MLRLAILAATLLPGTGNAQLFLSPGGGDALIPQLSFSTPEGSDPETGTILPDGAVAALDPASYDGSIVFDGATVAEIEALLANAAASGTSADRRNALIARVATAEDGSTLIALDVADADGGGHGLLAETVDLELGECNEGTAWVGDEMNCHNPYPATAD